MTNEVNYPPNKPEADELPPSPTMVVSQIPGFNILYDVNFYDFCFQEIETGGTYPKFKEKFIYLPVKELEDFTCAPTPECLELVKKLAKHILVTNMKTPEAPDYHWHERWNGYYLGYGKEPEIITLENETV